ncbi:MAG: AAA family ATPase [Ignavibacteriales bacterium]
MERAGQPAEDGLQSRVLVVAPGSNPARIQVPPGCTVVGCVGTAEAAASTIAALKPDVIVVDAAMYGRPGFTEMLNLAKAAFPSMKVENARAAQRPFDNPAIEPPCGDGRVTEAPAPRQAAARGLITVWSPKGGVGRTFLACNLAACVCGKEAHDVALVDLDLKWGDAAIHLGLNEGATILDALPYLDDAAVGSLRRYTLRDKRTGISILPAPGKPELSDLVSATQIKRAIALARKEFEFVFLDTPPDPPADLLGDLLEDSSAAVLVTTQDIACLRRVRLAMDMMNRLRTGAHRKTLIVVNQVSDATPTTVSHIESFLNTRVSGVLPVDRSAADSSIYEGVPLVAADPGHRLSRAIVAVAAQLCPDVDSGRTRGGHVSLAALKAVIQRRVTSGRPTGTVGQDTRHARS